MTYIPRQERVFPVRLVPYYSYYYAYHLHWLRNLLERLGREAALEVWNQAFQEEEDVLLDQILSAEWVSVSMEGEDGAAGASPHRTQIQREGADSSRAVQSVDRRIDAALGKHFPFTIEAVSAEEARRIVDKTRPFLQIAQQFPNMEVMREITTYEALHLFSHGIARLTESLMDLHGKRGELIAYDAMLADIAETQRQKMSVSEFMRKRVESFKLGSKEADIYSAGLERELIRVSDREVIWIVKECEWARYFTERHPDVGYMMACSTDNALYRSFNEQIRFQHTSSIMEGGDVCTYRLYAVGEEAE